MVRGGSAGARNLAVVVAVEFFEPVELARVARQLLADPGYLGLDAGQEAGGCESCRRDGHHHAGGDG